jgi:hypothetical protein
MLVISWVAAQLAASQEGLSSMSEWYEQINVENVFYFQWVFQPMQGLGLLFSSVIFFHRRQESLGEWSARRQAAT